MFDGSYIYLDLFRFEDSQVLNSKEYLKFKKENNLRKIYTFGAFNLVSSKKEKIPKCRNINKEEIELKYLLSMYGLDIFGTSEKELPQYLIDKIKYARRNGNVENLHYTMSEISNINHFKDYISLFKQEEIYTDINLFFSDVYRIIIDFKVKADVNLNLKKIIVNHLLNKEDMVFKSNDIHRMMVPILQSISKNNIVKEQLSSIINKFGFPYIVYKHFTESDDWYFCNLDYFMSIGILVTILNKLNYEIKDATNEVIRLFDLKDTLCNNIKDNKTYKEKLIDIIDSFTYTLYIDLIVNTAANTVPHKVELEFETKKVLLYNNLCDFYYKYFTVNLEAIDYKKKLKQEEANEIRLWFKKDYERLIESNPSKKEYYKKLIKELWEKDDNTIRRQYKSRKIVQN